MAAEQCGRETKAGKPCTAPRVTGRDGCAGHLGLGLAANPVAMQAKGAEARSAKRELRNRTPQDHLQAQLEARAKELVSSALDKASEGDITALRWAWEAVYGKPQERVQVQAEGDVRAMSPEARAELRRRALAAHPDLLELVPKHEANPVDKPDQQPQTG